MKTGPVRLEQQYRNSQNESESVVEQCKPYNCKICPDVKARASNEGIFFSSDHVQQQPQPDGSRKAAYIAEVLVSLCASLNCQILLVRGNLLTARATHQLFFRKRSPIRFVHEKNVQSQADER